MPGDASREQDLAGRVALVTGAASGMGAATVRELSFRGARPVLVDRNEAAARDLAAELPESHTLAGDVSEATFCDGAIAETIARYGRLDILVNAAGIIVRADALHTANEDWRRIVDVNVGGVFYMCRAALREMTKRRSGAIVNFGSMALDHADAGIRINAVAPGEVNTPMLSFGRAAPPSPEDLQRLADATIPMRRLAEPEEIARVVAFLVSGAASYMTGTIVPVDAGYTAR